MILIPKSDLRTINAIDCDKIIKVKSKLKECIFNKYKNNLETKIRLKLRLL
jgi:hypothetical protein